MGCVDVSVLARSKPSIMKKLLFVVNIDWFFISHRLPIAVAAKRAGYDVHIATIITDGREVLEKHGLTVHPLGLVRDGVGLINALKTVLDLRRIFVKLNPDLVHLVTIKPVLLGGFVAQWLRVPALVSAISGLGYVFTGDGLKAWIFKWWVARLYTGAFSHPNQIVIFQNTDDRDTLLSAGCLCSDKVAIIGGSGVNLEEFTVKPEPDGYPVVVFPARFLKDKGVLEFVEAARIVRSERKHVRFVLVGLLDKSNPTSLSQPQIDKWVSDGVIENWGFCVNMQQVFASASLVVLPSYREGLPKVLLEAASCGRAIVTTDVPGCRDAIVPGVTGSLVEVRDAVALANEIERLLSDPEQLRSMGMAGRRLVEDKFDVKNVVSHHLDIYQRLLV